MKKRVTAVFGNRIVKTGSVPAGQLLGNENNWRIHTTEQETVLTSILHVIGFVQGAILNMRTGKEWGRNRNVETMIDGHLRAKIALGRGEETPVPCVWVDLTPDEEATVLATLDPIGAMAHTDREKVAEVWKLVPEDLRELTKVLRQDRKSLSKKVEFEAQEHCRLVVECASDSDRAALMQRLGEEGYVCRVG